MATLYFDPIDGWQLVSQDERVLGTWPVEEEEAARAALEAAGGGKVVT